MPYTTARGAGGATQEGHRVGAFKGAGQVPHTSDEGVVTQGAGRGTGQGGHQGVAVKGWRVATQGGVHVGPLGIRGAALPLAMACPLSVWGAA